MMASAQCSQEAQFRAGDMDIPVSWVTNHRATNNKFVVSYFPNTHPRFLCRNAGSFYFQFRLHQRIQKPTDLQVTQRDRYQKLQI